MKITREELEIRVMREIKNFYKYKYTPGEIERQQTQFFYLIRDLKTYRSQGGDVYSFRDSFLLKLVKEKKLRDEVEDFLYDIVDVINDHCPAYLSLFDDYNPDSQDS